MDGITFSQIGAEAGSLTEEEKQDLVELDAMSNEQYNSLKATDRQRIDATARKVVNAFAAKTAASREIKLALQEDRARVVFNLRRENPFLPSRIVDAIMSGASPEAFRAKQAGLR